MRMSRVHVISRICMEEDHPQVVCVSACPYNPLVFVTKNDLDVLS